MGRIGDVLRKIETDVNVVTRARAELEMDAGGNVTRTAVVEINLDLRDDVPPALLKAVREAAGAAFVPGAEGGFSTLRIVPKSK